jgi:hypothetical protein
MTQFLRRKATKLPEPVAMQRKSNSFLAPAKTASKQARATPIALRAPPAATPAL